MQVQGERDTLVTQLEKSQEMLVTFQQELQGCDAELAATRKDNDRLKREQDQMMRDQEKGSRDLLHTKEQEFQRLQQQVRTLKRSPSFTVE